MQILQSNASPREKDAACALFKRIGTARCVPVLAALLTDEQLSHSARYALESLNAPEAGKALIEPQDLKGQAPRLQQPRDHDVGGAVFLGEIADRLHDHGSVRDTKSPREEAIDGPDSGRGQGPAGDAQLAGAILQKYLCLPLDCLNRRKMPLKR